MKNLKVIMSVFTALAMVFVMSVSQATTLSFVNIENNSSIDFSGQLSTDVTTDGSYAYFKVFNDVDSGTYASITEVYFDYDTTLTTVSFYADSGTNVAFTDGANPANLPGGNDPAINFSADYSTDADNKPGIQKENGVDATGEFITFMATLSSLYNYDALLNSLADGTFRIGLHISAIPDGYDNSDSYVNIIPVPAAAWLFGTALFGFFATSRRKKNS